MPALGVTDTNKMNERHILVVSLWLKNNNVSAFEAFERQRSSSIDSPQNQESLLY